MDGMLMVPVVNDYMCISLSHIIVTNSYFVTLFFLFIAFVHVWLAVVQWNEACGLDVVYV